MSNELTQSVFAALADSTRRHLVERLTQGSATITELTADLPMSRQAVTKHLNILAEAGLVKVTPSGRERHYALSLTPLESATFWIAGIEQKWDERLGRLKQMLVDEGDVAEDE